MGSCVIISAGDFPTKEYPLYLLRTADRIVCCDGAFRTFLRRSEAVFGFLRLPDAVVGDMDSLPSSLAEKYRGIIVKIDEQEHNDQTKAVRYVLEHFKDIDSIHILGATGKREVHTLGNLSLLMEYTRAFGVDGLTSSPTVDIVSDRCTAIAVTDSCTLEVGQGRPISVITTDNSLQIRSEGLEWPTDEVVFDNLWKATLNRASSDTVCLKFSHPSMALVILE
ncbi:MAG: thiamine diphosphokinase [Bacteroidales bacterium]|nr:thiamine diphosphokinase [Bacteroidales bacterium]